VLHAARIAAFGIAQWRVRDGIKNSSTGKHARIEDLKGGVPEHNAGLMRELLAESEIRATGLFEPQAVSRFVREHEENRANHSHLLWALMVFQLWRRRFLLPASYEPRLAAA
jgi:hypothetical protein